MDLIKIYNYMKQKECTIFVGKRETGLLLNYVLNIKFVAYKNSIDDYDGSALYLIDDIEENVWHLETNNFGDNIFFLSSFLSVLDILNETEYNLKEMFIKMINDHPLRHISCRAPFTHVYVNPGGKLTHCCYAWLPFFVGNVCDLNQNPADSILSRIIRASFLNHTYSFCNTNLCPYMHASRESCYSEDSMPACVDEKLDAQRIEYIDVSFDYTCNLRCRSCRKELIVESNEELMHISDMVGIKLLPTAKRMLIAGNGEVFLSKAYRNILLSNNHSKDMTLVVLSNGMLFDEKAWRLIDGRYHRIELYVSVDAARKETYEYLRVNGKWEMLMRNLHFASALRSENKISRFIINFVVQRDNYQEIPEFVEMGIDLKCDEVRFNRIEYWSNSGITSEEFYKSKSMYDKDGKSLSELRDILKNPILKNKVVNMQNVVV